MTSSIHGTNERTKSLVNTDWTSCLWQSESSSRSEIDGNEREPKGETRAVT